MDKNGKVSMKWFPKPVAGGTFGSWAFSADLPDFILLLMPPLLHHNYRNDLYYRTTQYNVA